MTITVPARPIQTFGKEIVMIKGESRPGQKLYRVGMSLLLILGLCPLVLAEETSTAAAVSQFLEEVAKEEYQETAPPPAAPKLRWDFSQAEVVHAYTFEQETHGTVAMDSPGFPEASAAEQEGSVEGTLLIKSQGGGTANMVLSDMVARAKTMFSRLAEPQIQEQQVPPIVVQGVNEDSSGSFGNSSQDLLLRMLFPLPSRELALGESVDEPEQLPFNAMGSTLQVTGRSRITLSRFVKIGARTCAQLDVDIDISQLTVPAELEGEYRFSARGKSSFYFDIAERRFVSGTNVLLVELSVDAPMPHFGTPNDSASEAPGRAKMATTSDSLTRVRLKE